MEKKINFEGITFPIVKNVYAKTIGSLIKPVKPAKEGKIKERYTNHWGEVVTIYETGGRITHSTTDNKMYGDYGHAYGFGWYIINEKLDAVYTSDPEYDELFKKCLPVWTIMNKLREIYKSPDYSVERGRGDRIFVNDKMIKGIALSIGGRSAGIEAEVEGISEMINLAIKHKDIIPGKFGI
jgi:hypothetical protein